MGEKGGYLHCHRFVGFLGNPFWNTETFGSSLMKKKKQKVVFWSRKYERIGFRFEFEYPLASKTKIPLHNSLHSSHGIFFFFFFRIPPLIASRDISGLLFIHVISYSPRVLILLAQPPLNLESTASVDHLIRNKYYLIFYI